MDALANPVINSPYEEPARHFVLDDQVRPTGDFAETRRPSELFVPIPKPKKGGGKGKRTATTLDFDTLTDERVEKNDKIDYDALRAWRLQGCRGATFTATK